SEATSSSNSPWKPYSLQVSCSAAGGCAVAGSASARASASRERVERVLFMSISWGREPAAGGHLFLQSGSTGKNRQGTARRRRGRRAGSGCLVFRRGEGAERPGNRRGAVFR